MKGYATIAIIFLLMMATSIPVQAQKADPAKPPAVAEKEPEKTDEMQPESKSLGGMIVSGGTLNIVFFGILGVFSLWAATVALERIVNLKRDKLLPGSFESQLAQAVEQTPGDANKFRSLCGQTDAPVSRILQAGITRAGRPLPEVEKAMEDAAAREMSTLRAKSRPLNVVGSIAPLVGLLGTVVGMIIAFQISSQEGLGKAERLAEGIYLALMTTAAGLTIAIPCLLFASWCQARAERFMCDIADCLNTTIPSFAAMEGQPLQTATRANNDPVQEADLSPREKFLREGLVEPAKG